MGSESGVPDLAWEWGEEGRLPVESTCPCGVSGDGGLSQWLPVPGPAWQTYHGPWHLCVHKTLRPGSAQLPDIVLIIPEIF